MLSDAVFFDKGLRAHHTNAAHYVPAQRQQAAVKNLQGQCPASDTGHHAEFEDAPIQGHSPNTLF